MFATISQFITIYYHRFRIGASQHNLVSGFKVVNMCEIKHGMKLRVHIRLVHSSSTPCYILILFLGSSGT